MKEFDKIIGYEAVKNELYQIIDMFKNKELYSKMGANIPLGILIHGAPGLGKTMLAMALIEECNTKTFILKKNKSNDDSVKEITDTFEQAAKEDNAIILLDDIDKYSESSDDYSDDSAFVAIQTGIDNVKDKNVLVIATANNLRKLPKSLVRKGRFDRKICLERPSYSDARKIIEYYMKDKSVDPNLNYDDVAKMINYTSCADLQTMVNESAIYAVYQRKPYVDINDMIKVYIRDKFDSSVETYECSEERYESTALHEAGHVVVSEVIKEGCVGFVTIQNTGDNIVEGFTYMCDKLTRRPENVLVALAGKAAVELYYEGRCASGCQSDISKAADYIRDGISESGTCGIAMVDVANERFPQTSESLKARNEAVTQAEFERYMFLTKDILIKNKEFLMQVTKILKEKRALVYSDIQKIRKSVNITGVVVQ